MSEISASYQPNKIKRKGYTSWIDESNQFCTTTTGITLDQVRGQNLMDAFDVDWSAYRIDGQVASAASIINKLNTPATAINNFLGVLENQDDLLSPQDRSTKEGSYWIVGTDIDIIIGEKTYKSLHAGDQVIINVGAHDYDIVDASGFEQCYYCVQINMSGYLPLTGGTMQGNINFKSERNTIYGTDDDLHIDANNVINLDAQETHTFGLRPKNDTVNIGSSTNAFNDIYANRFIKSGSSDSYVLLGGGGTKLLSDFTPDLSGYLRLAGGTMTGAIDFDWNGSDIHNMLTLREQSILQLDDTDQIKLYLGTAAQLPLTVHELTTNGDILPSTSAPEIGMVAAIVPGQTLPTYISLGSDDKYFDKVYARQFKGLADNALKLYTYGTGIQSLKTPHAINKGNASTPVYFNDGVPVECNSIPTSDTVASWGYVMSSGITRLNVGDGLQGKADNDDLVNTITTSVGTISLKTASDSEIGGIQLGYIQTGKNYPVQLSSNRAYVNVPWTDTLSTDEKAKQTSLSNAGEYPLLCKYDTTNDTTTNSVNFVSGVTVNPSAQTITTPKLNISHLGAGGDDFNNNVKYPVTNKALVIGTVANKTTCLYINRSGIQAWNSTTDTKLTDSSIPSMYLQGAGGNVICGGAVNATAFYETSDIRKKEIKSDLSLDKCYDLIDKCQTVIYSLKDQTKEQIGMIAQEIEEFFPEVVATDEEGFKSLAYDRLVVICFKVFKDVIKRLEKLENE